MLKRSMIVITAAALLLAPCFSGDPALAASKKAVIQFVNTLPENELLAEHLHAAAKDVLSKSGMTVRLQMVAGPGDGSQEETFRWMRAGRIDGGVFSAGVLGKMSGNYLIPGLPRFLLDYQEVDAVRAKFEELLTNELGNKGYLSMGMIEAGFVYFMGKEPIRKPSGLLGKKLWTPPWDDISQSSVMATGAEMVKLPFQEVAAALKDGRVDVVAASPMLAESLGWTESVKYVTDLPLLFHYGAICFTQEGWDRIPENQREDIHDVLVRHSAEISEESRKRNQAAINIMRAKGIVFVKMDPRSMTTVDRTAEAANRMIRARGLYDVRMFDRIFRVVQTLRALR